MPCSAAEAGLNVCARLARWAADTPQSVALIDGGRRLSFAGLDETAARLGAGLEAHGVGRGARVVLMVPPSAELYALTFALFRVGAVPVFVDPGVGWNHLRDCLGQAEPSAFIGTPKAHLGRVLGGWAKKSIKTRITARGWFPGTIGLTAVRRGAGSLRAPRSPEPGETAAILFTSGSTGAPKGAVYTHEMFGAQIDALRALFDCRPGEVSLATFPLFGLFDVCLGMTVVIPRMDATRPGFVEPRRIHEPLETHGAAQLFGSPALLDRLNEPMPGLKRILTAGAPVQDRILKKITALTPAAVYTPYGATEALPVACVDSAVLAETSARTAEGFGVCVGRPAPGADVRIMKIVEGPVENWTDDLGVSSGEVGEIVVSGPMVSASYFGRPDATRAHKFRLADGALFHRMGDLGRFDEQGRLWFCGRKTERVVAPSGTLYTACAEGIFNAHPGVKRCALVSGPTLVVEPASEAGKLETLREELLELSRRHEAARGIAHVLFRGDFPVDRRHNAKIDRAQLGRWAARELASGR